MNKPVCSRICAAIGAALLAAAAGAVEVHVPFDPAQSTLTMRVCRDDWTCDLRAAQVKGYWRVDVDSVAAPTTLTLKGLVIAAQASIASVSTSGLSGAGAGTFQLSATNQRLALGGWSGASYGPASVLAAQYRINDLPVDVFGTYSWSATGAGCISSSPTPCAGVSDSATFNSRIGNLFGGISSTGNLLTLSGSISVLVPLDIIEPGAATVSYIVNVRGTGSRCAADFNASGAATIDDIFAFLTAWFAADPNADTTLDGAISIDDIFAFLNAWFAGCP